MEWFLAVDMNNFTHVRNYVSKAEQTPGTKVRWRRYFVSSVQACFRSLFRALAHASNYQVVVSGCSSASCRPFVQTFGAGESALVWATQGLCTTDLDVCSEHEQIHARPRLIRFSGQC
jgi:hypothetical protein